MFFVTHLRISFNLSYSFGTRAQTFVKYMKVLVCLVVSPYKKLSYQTTLSFELVLNNLFASVAPHLSLKKRDGNGMCTFFFKKLP